MTTVVTWLWQGLAITAMAAILVRAVPRLNAATRHVIWWLALVVVLIQPWTTAAPAATVAIARSTDHPTAAAAASLLHLPTLHLPSPPEWLLLSMVALWAGLVCFNLYRMAAGVRLIGRLKNSSRRIDRSHQDRLPLWSAMRRLGRQVDLRMSDTAASPCALGLGRPVILIPSRLVATLSDRDLDLIVTHEHAHLTRYDDWFRLLQCAIVALAGIHPAVRLIARQIDLEREAACDDRVVLQAGDPRSYAYCLTTVAGLVTRINPAAAAVAPLVVGSGSRLRVRVTRLLDHRSNRTPRLARCATMATAATLMLAVLASDRIPPLVVIGGGRADASPLLSANPSANLSAPLFTMFPAAPVEPPSPSSTATRDDDNLDVVAVIGAGASADRPPSRLTIVHGRIDSPSAEQGITQPVAGPDVRPAGDLGSANPMPLKSRSLMPVLNLSPVASDADDPGDPGEAHSEQAGGLAQRAVAAGQQMGRLGQSVGTSSRRAGTSVGRFFSRTGRSIAGGF